MIQHPRKASETTWNTVLSTNKGCAALTHEQVRKGGAIMMRLILHHWAFHAYVVWLLVVVVVILWREGHVSTIVKKLWHKRRVSVPCPSRQRMTTTTTNIQTTYA